jgi:inhibitor of growth protein 3
MPRIGRDDLTIDAHFRNMPQIEHQDCAAVLDEFVNRTANLPNEVLFMQEEMLEKDKQLAECIKIITRNDDSIQKWIKINGSHLANPKEDHCRKLILDNYDKAAIIQTEKMALAQKTQAILDKHTRWIDGHIKVLQDRNEFPNDPDLPSTLRPQINGQAPRVEASAAIMPVGQIPNSAAVVHLRHPNQHPPRAIPPQVQAHQIAGPSASSAPATPAAPLLMHRQQRESSLGAASSKRQRLTGGLGNLPATSSGLARHTSLTPNTPRAGTPGSSTRAGSAGPRAVQKTTAGSKKVAPNGSRQSGVLRKAKPVKSRLSRVKTKGDKNSPSSTNDSELSDAESGSGEEEDEAVTPPARDAEGDDDMADIDDDEGGDDKKYCLCQNVSFGDMVACDNETCPYEWFHWTCVGLKSEPVGTWICPVCTKDMKK